MSIVSIVMLGFSLLGALDRIFGNKFGLGKEFERGFQMMGTLALAMLGMIVLAPALAEGIKPILNLLPSHIDPSVITSVIFANDMGGAPLAIEIANDPELGRFNGLITGAMMGCTVSFTIPFALSAVDKERQKDVLTGLLCGIVTIPVGCLIGGWICGISFPKLVLNVFPLLLFSAILTVGLIFAPNLCVKIFTWLGYLIKALITVGLLIGMIHLLTGYAPFSITPLTEACETVLTATVVLSGAFPLLFLLTKILKKPLSHLSKKKNVSTSAVMGFLATTATSATVFGGIKNMNRREAVVQSAFTVSGSFLLTDHLAFTLSFAPEYLPAVTAAKITAALSAIAVAIVLTRKDKKEIRQ